jgi:hypothetical protein
VSVDTRLSADPVQGSVQYQTQDSVQLQGTVQIKCKAQCRYKAQCSFRKKDSVQLQGSVQIQIQGSMQIQGTVQIQGQGEAADTRLSSGILVRLQVSDKDMCQCRYWLGCRHTRSFTVHLQRTVKKA